MYYTAKQAIEKLRIPESTFYQMVKDGRIRSFLPKHRRRGALYDQAEIDAIAEIQQQIVPNQTSVVNTYRRVSDFAQQIAIDAELYGLTNFVYLHTLQAWQKRNPDMFLALAYKSGEFIGYANLTPMKHDTIMRVMRGEILYNDIPPEDIFPFAPDSPRECCLLAFAIQPGALGNYYASELSSGMANHIAEMARKGTIIDTFYYSSTHHHEQERARRMGFTELSRNGHDSRVAFILPSTTPEIELTFYYQLGHKSFLEKQHGKREEDLRDEKSGDKHANTKESSSLDIDEAARLYRLSTIPFGEVYGRTKEGLLPPATRKRGRPRKF